jgi:Zn-dependent protease with chaperone function
MKRIVSFLPVILLMNTIILSSCNKDNSGVNIFTVEDDKQLGLQMEQEIQGNPAEYPLLQPTQYNEAYQHVEQVRDDILATGLVDFDIQFEWTVHIINDDSVLNAFCTPGGYIYFYTGLIRYLDNDAQFAGVMGHEMAHAARRHSTQQMTKAYGLQMLLSVVLGENPNMIAQMAAELAAGVASLAFSREDEYEADEYSVRYLYNTTYDARGVAGFFEKIGGSDLPPEFLSTHPNPENRIEKIYEVWQGLGGKTGETYPTEYAAFKNSLP